ncbi:MAG: hypothetical protein ACK4TP_04860 [Hyphomicrobium sp.]
MFEYFLDRSQGWRVLAHVVAPIIWFQTTLLMTGIYTSYNHAQRGRPMEETPFFGGEVATERLGSIMASGHAQIAFAFYVLDLINAILLAAGLAAMIGFGLRALRRHGPLARMALVVPFVLVSSEFLENGLLATALAFPASLMAVGAVAGIATGAKFLFFGLAALLGSIGAIVGVSAWAWRLLRRQ